jgi:hypothetical protein
MDRTLPLLAPLRIDVLTLLFRPANDAHHRVREAFPKRGQQVLDMPRNDRKDLAATATGATHLRREEPPRPQIERLLVFRVYPKYFKGCSAGISGLVVLARRYTVIPPDGTIL